MTEYEELKQLATDAYKAGRHDIATKAMDKMEAMGDQPAQQQQTMPRQQQPNFKNRLQDYIGQEKQLLERGRDTFNAAVEPAISMATGTSRAKGADPCDTT